MRGILTRRRLNALNAVLGCVLAIMLVRIVFAVTSPSVVTPRADDPAIRPADRRPAWPERSIDDYSSIMLNDLFNSKMPEGPPPPLPALPDPTKALDVKGTVSSPAGRCAFITDRLQRDLKTGQPMVHEVRAGDEIWLSHPQGRFRVRFGVIDKDHVEYEIVEWENHDLSGYLPEMLMFSVPIWE